MKNPKDIFDLFKDNEHKLNTPPSPRAWDRLEARLDNRQRQTATPGLAPMLLRNWLSMAAVVLLLVTCISALSILFTTQSEKKAMAHSNANASFVLEEIGIYSDQNTTVDNFITYQKQMKRLNTNPIMEGDPSKELRVQQAIFVALENRNRELDKRNHSNRANKQLAMQSAQPTVSVNATLNVSAATTASVKDSDLVYNDSQIEAFALDEGSMPVSLSEITGNDAGTEKSDASLSQFDWLLGKWEVPVTNNSTTYADAAKSKKERNTAPAASVESKAATNSEQSFEQWTKRDGQTLVGSGYVLKNGQEIFVEQMRIEQVGSDLYYVLSLPEQNVERRYALRSYDANEVVFENITLSFPNQVLLLPANGNQQLTIVLQNSNPVLIDAKMRAYFEHRNEISSEQIRRVMWKVK
jgi:Domain of unknown function (DUF6265)